MAELTLVEAVNDALHTEMARDDAVLVMGQDVGRAGGVFRATAGLRDRFGADRCVDTPLAEAGILGTAVGLCMAGWRPVVEMQYDAFSYPCLDQLINHVGRYRWRTRGGMEFPLVVRMPYGGGVRAPELHDDSPEAYYVHTPGVKVAIPSTPADAKGLLAAAIRDPDPVVVLEPKFVYRTARGEVPEGEHVVPLGEMRVAREGSDLTLVAYGAMVPVAEQAADRLDASVEILDVRSLKPLDEETLARVGREDRPRRDRPGGAAGRRLRRGARRDRRREGDPRPPRPGPARHRLRRAVSVLADRGRVHAVGRPGRGGGAAPAHGILVAYEFKLPDLGEGLTEGEVARWFVQEGQEIAEDDPLVEIQTDKTTVEIPSPAAGKVARILVAEGDVVPVGTVLVVIGEDAQAGTGIGPVPEARATETQVRATPLVRKIAKELGVDLAAVTGTGPNGQVTEADVRGRSSDTVQEGRREKLRGVRRLIAEHMARAHREVPPVTWVEECDFEELDLKLLVPAALKAAALSLQEYPELNARLEGDEIVYLDRYDIGVAVQTDQGLVVPVVRGCDSRPLADLADEVARLADAARAGTLAHEDLRGSTFTVTSAGKLGGLFHTPIVNYPEVAIMGIGRIAPRPVVRDGEVVVRKTGTLAVTFDHRVVDGARASEFGLAVIRRLESPAGLS